MIFLKELINNHINEKLSTRPFHWSLGKFISKIPKLRFPLFYLRRTDKGLSERGRLYWLWRGCKSYISNVQSIKSTVIRRMWLVRLSWRLIRGGGAAKGAAIRKKISCVHCCGNFEERVENLSGYQRLSPRYNYPQRSLDLLANKNESKNRTLQSCLATVFTRWYFEYFGLLLW